MVKVGWCKGRRAALCLLALLFGGTAFPLQAQQYQPVRLFGPELGQAVYAPLEGVARAKGMTLAALSTRGLQPEGAEVTAPPAEGRATAALLAGGLAGGVAGLLIGGATAAGLGTLGCTEGCGESGLYWALLGAAVGETLSLPLGVHLTNRRQGSYLQSTLASMALTGAGIWIGFSLPETPTGDRGRAILLVAVPIMQLASSIQIERWTARR
jgi:hypothetical protein